MSADPEEAKPVPRRRVASLTSTTGALLLGLGLGALFPGALGSGDGATALVLVGLAMHGWGMLDLRRLDRGGRTGRAPWWADAPYWLCWLALAAVLASLFLA